MSFIPINDKPATSPSRTTLRARLSKYSKLAVQDLKDVLTQNESKISLALDCWSSRSRQGYLGTFVTYIWSFHDPGRAFIRYIFKNYAYRSAITCHWIDSSWELRDALLEFKHVPGHHTGVRLADEVFDILQKYNIVQKLYCITTDNASNNTTMMHSLSQRLREEEDYEWDPDQHHISCLNHIINLAVEDFIKNVKGFERAGIIIDDDTSDDEQADDDDDDELLNEEEGMVKTIFKC